MMDSNEEDEHTLIQHNTYPDPEDVPLYPWVGTSNLEELDEGGEAFLPAEPEVSRLRNASQSRGGLTALDATADHSRQANDSDFQNRDDGSISDEMISDADSDIQLLDDPSSSTRGKRGRGGRSRGRGRGRGGGRGKRTLLEDGHGVSQGRGRRRVRPPVKRGGKGIKRGIRKPLEPSADFKAIHSQATMAFIDQDYDKAAELARQAISNNPEIFTAHSLLSEVHFAQGDKARATTALFHGAHTRPRDTQIWNKVAELILERAGEDRVSAIPDAIYCYNRIIDADPAHVEARYQRASLHRELGNKKQAASDYRRLLKQLPHDTIVLRHLAEIYIEIGESSKAIDYYNGSITYYRNTEPKDVTGFSWSDANIYAELFIYAEDFKTGLLKVKEVCRWLLGREEEDYWNWFREDDREFDADDEPRRNEIQHYVAGKYETASYGEGLPLELRVKLGLFRLRLGYDHFEEAMMHLDWLEPDVDQPGGKLLDYPDLFREVADALRTQCCYHEALRFYEPLQQVAEFADASYFDAMGTCYQALELYNEAEDCYRIVVENESENIEVYTKMAKMFESAGMLERATQYIDKVGTIRQQLRISGQQQTTQKRPIIKAPRRASEDPQDETVPNLLEPPVARKSASQPSREKRSRAEDNREEVRLLFLQQLNLKEQMNDGYVHAKVEWTRTASSLIDSFKKEKAFFPNDKSMKYVGKALARQTKNHKGSQNFDEIESMARRLQVSLEAPPDDSETKIPEDYCGISFDNWLDLFLGYAMSLAKDDKIETAYEIIKVVYDANIFYHSQAFMFRLHIAWSTCALIANDAETLCNVARYFMKEYQFVTDSYRLYSTLNRLCERPNLWYNSGPSQKYILRQIKAMDLLLTREETRELSVPERASYSTKEKDDDPIRAKELDIALLMLYGHILYTGTSHAYALSYFYRAYALNPTNPMVTLSLALGYTHYAIKRQSENRHYLLLQGFSFLSAYYDIRRESNVPAERQEAEFNVGRMYHMLGLTHLAIPHYEKCLEMDVQFHGTTDEGFREKFTIEAAFALQVLWASNGEMGMARKVTEKWLVL